MAQEYASSIKGEALRLVRLNSAGVPLLTISDIYVLNSFITVSFTPEYEDGEELTQKTAAGEICTNYKMPDVLKRVTLELAVCDPDPELDALLVGNSYLLSNGSGQNVGWAAPPVGVSTAGNGVALEVWSAAIVNGKPSTTLPYWRWLFPLTYLRPSGTREVGASIMANTYSGYGIGNSSYGDGVNNTWAGFEAVITAGSPFVYVRTSTPPPDRTGAGMYVTGSGGWVSGT